MGKFSSGDARVGTYDGTERAFVPTVNMASSGGTSDAAYSDATGAADGSVVSLLKGIYVQNAAMIALLTQIETNTAAP